MGDDVVKLPGDACAFLHHRLRARTLGHRLFTHTERCNRQFASAHRIADGEHGEEEK
jgi:hypothetical protein